MKRNKFTTIITSGILTVLFCLSSNLALQAADNDAVAKLTNIEIQEIDAQNVKVVITTDMPVHYKYFKINNPPVIAVDLIGTVKPGTASTMDVGKGMVKGVRAGQNRLEPKKITRVVIDLTDEKTGYEVTKTDNQVIVAIGPAAEKSSTDQMTQPEKATSTDKMTKEPAIEQYPALPVAVPEQPKVEERAPVAEKAVPAEAPAVEIPTAAPAEEKKEAVEPAPAIPSTTEEATLAPPSANEPTSNAGGQVEENNNLLTLNFKDADIRDVLRILSLKSGINMVYGDDVTGTITVHLDNVTFENAFDIILSLKGLTYEKVTDNVYRIATPAKISSERATMVTATEVYVINYADAQEISGSLASVLGSQGKIQIDKRTNSLIVSDTPANLRKVADMIKALDIETPQVMIEAQLVEIGNTDLQYLGLNWNATKTVPYKDTTTDITAKNQLGGATFTGGANGTLTVATVMNNAQLNATLSALATKGKSKILSNPKISTINNKQARILVGDKVPYTLTTTTTTGTTSSTQYIDVGIKLDVTPSINSNGLVKLKVHPEVSFVKEWRAEGPVISTREADTEVLIKSGETVAIGGLITDQDKQDSSKIPFIGDIPILGYLFTQRNSDKEKTELLVFITPRVISVSR
jgi:type IV pilus assembly protein PilQ